MVAYSLREVEGLLSLFRTVVSGLIGAGFVTPKRGARGELRFDFVDLMKTGKELPEADGFAWVPLQKVREHCAVRMGKLLLDEGVLRRAIALVFQP